MKINWIEEKENIEKLINDGISYEAIGRMYCVTGAAVKKNAKKLGIILTPKRSVNPNEHFNKGKKIKDIEDRYCLNCGKKLDKAQVKFCNFQCQQNYSYKEYIKRWKNGEEDGIKGMCDVSNHLRRYLFEKNNNKCQKCGWHEVNEYTNKIPLEIHHIDGDCTNNSEDNLQLLCPNCHSLTDTFGILNKNSKRYKHKKSKQ